MPAEDPGRLADELEEQADELEQHGADVRRRIDDTRQEWEAKRADESVPGANPPPEPESSQGDDSGATSEGGPAGVGEPGSTGRDGE